MLLPEQAQTIVNGALNLSGWNTPSSGADRLSSLKPNPAADLMKVITMVIAQASSLGHHIEPTILGNLDESMTVTGLTSRVMQLAVGKLCQNPTSPHPQIFPYPTECPQCGFPVR